MKKILIVIPELTYSGSMFSSLRICKVLLANGFACDVWSYKEGEFSKEFLKIGIKPDIINPETFFVFPDVKKKIKGYDLVIVNTIIAYAMADLCKNIVPTIWYIREAQNLKWQFFRNDIRRYYAIKRAENIYVVSEYAKEFIVENYNSNVRVVHNAVEDEINIFEEKPGANNKLVKFLALGTIEERKAFDIFIKAYLCLGEEERAKSEVHFAGRLIRSAEDYYRPLLNIAEKEQGVFYHGEIQEREKLLKLIFDSDVIVVPSKDESCSLVALEGAMMAKPLIISENVGAKYIITKENGWIFKTDEVNELSEIYREAIHNRERLREMGECSRKIYLQTSSLTVYEKNILKMVKDNMVFSKVLYRIKHIIMERQERQLRQKEFFGQAKKYLFLEEELSPGSRIAIYAAGEVGKAYKQYVEEKKKYEIALWVDKNACQVKSENTDICEVSELLRRKYDYVIIAVFKKEVADEIRKELVLMGIENDTIKWCQPRLVDC